MASILCLCLATGLPSPLVVEHLCKLLRIYRGLVAHSLKSRSKHISAMFSPFLLVTTLLLPAWCTAVVVIPSGSVAGLATRQTSAFTDPECLSYSRTANLSTIASNSTYRSAFLQASPDGTMRNQHILTAAIQAVTPLIGNQALNQVCGNLTAIAITEAERNFTLGIVAQFSDVSSNPQAITAGLEILAVSVGSMCVFFALSHFVL